MMKGKEKALSQRRPKQRIKAIRTDFTPFIYPSSISNLGGIYYDEQRFNEICG